MRPPSFASPLHDERIAAMLGISLAIAFSVCFATGLMSHLAYDQPSWWPLGPRPAGLYRFTQGLHVATGIASIPLLLVKLWVVYPSFWTWPPVRSVTHAVERISLLPLVGGSLFLLFSGAGNLARWRPWGFFFTDGHYHAAWITIGALVVHIGAKTTTAVTALRPPIDVDADVAGSVEGLTRRQLLAAAATSSAVLTVATVGQTFRPLAGAAVLAPRDPRVGPQGVPVNGAASSLGVLERLDAPGFAGDYRLLVDRGGATVLPLTLADLRDLPTTEATLPIACVEGWSADGRWRGVAIRDVLAAAGADDVETIVVASMQERGRYRTSELTSAWIADRHTLLAYELNGEPLIADHGYPLRLIAPNRPGVLQTKWVTSVEVL
jgi:DMSO/TMAO reductase YedYZ molybdopterin-dependent catalytic subunit